jgi:hypothetical protein
MSNNGDAEPIAYERDFSMSVGSVITTTTTMTAIVTAVSTPVTSTNSELNLSAWMRGLAN